MSKGQFLLTGEILPRWYASRSPGSAYVVDEGLGGFVDFVWEILIDVDEDTDLGRYDNDGPDGMPNSGDDDGFVDLIFINTLSAPQGFILGRATGIAILGIYPEFVSNDPAARGGFIKIRGDQDPNGVGGVVLRGHTFETAVATMAHEFGHMLGLPDLHDLKFEDPQRDSAGIGYWGLMAHGTRGWFEQGGPNPFSAWSLEQLDWIGVENEDLVVVEENLNDVVFEDVNAGGKVYKVASKSSFLYYLVEHRRSDTSYYERDLPAEGLLIWRIDTLQRTNQVESEKKVDLVCADGLYDDAGFPFGRESSPEHGSDNLDFWAHENDYRTEHRGNLGDATDVSGGVRFREFSVISNPVVRDGINISDIRKDGQTMIANVHVDDIRRAGPILSDQVWTDTIEVIGDVTIGVGSRVTIRPGTVVRFDRDRGQSGRDPRRIELDVHGELLATGTSDSPVTFTSRSSNPQGGDWFGITIASTGRVLMQDVELGYANNGLVGSELSRSLSLRDVTIHDIANDGVNVGGILTISATGMEVRDAGGAGMRVAGDGFLVVSSSRFIDNSEVGLERIGGELAITGNEFVGNGTKSGGAHLNLIGSVSGQVSGNHFEGGVGIHFIDTPAISVEANQFVDNRIGVMSSNARPLITGNEFSGNDLVIQVSGTLMPTRVELNIVVDSRLLLENLGSAELLATNNWWDMTDAVRIEERMSGEVQWEPFLTFDPRKPLSFGLNQNYPNPFNGSTVIDYSIDLEAFDAGDGEVTLDVYALTGGRVRRLVGQPASPGTFSVTWDGLDDRGVPVASGVYSYQLTIGSTIEVRRRRLLK